MRTKRDYRSPLEDYGNVKYRCNAGAHSTQKNCIHYMAMARFLLAPNGLRQCWNKTVSGNCLSQDKPIAGGETMRAKKRLPVRLGELVEIAMRRESNGAKVLYTF